MGVNWGGVDLESTYGFIVSRDGFDPGVVEARGHWVQVPGRDGERYVRLERGKRTGMVLRGYIEQSSFSALQTQIYGLDNEFLKVCSVHPDGNYAAITFTTKDLYLPSYTRYYPSCLCVSFRYSFKSQPQTLATKAFFEIGFEQEVPQMIVGTPA